ncbi:F-box only protein 24 [Esox lucius]|uniref:F-box only protein 24 n=1 Tax=Esox lucius TaxID=8010 RepID=UPI0014768C55|nr:F-box only protein 24 [Esox lucius]
MCCRNVVTGNNPDQVMAKCRACVRARVSGDCIRPKQGCTVALSPWPPVGRPKKEPRKFRPASESDVAEAPPRSKRRTITPTEGGVTVQSLPPELLEEILSRVSVRDVIAFGATCSTFYQLSLSPSLWRRLCHHQAASGQLAAPPSTDWRRTAILKYSQGLQMHCLTGAGSWTSPWRSYRAATASLAVVPPSALGYIRLALTRDHVLVFDSRGTIFLLRNTLALSSHSPLVWRRAAGHSVLCQNAKDFAVDPRSNTSFSQFIYVLIGRGHAGSEPSPSMLQCDCVEVYQQDTGNRVFRMTFHTSMTFVQLRLTGSEVNRILLLLTDTGKVYKLSVNETQLNTSRSYTVQLVLKKISTFQPHVPVAQIHTSFSSILYLTGEGSAYVEAHSRGVYRHLFGTNQDYDPQDPHDAQTPLPLLLPYKVVKCSLGLSHLCLLDDCGRIFMQGINRFGQLGTGDKIDRGEPTQVVLNTLPVEVWCGLNHSLALLQKESGEKEVQGCGCGFGGRLPGCPKGSAVFIKLRISVPRAARSLCASKDCLFLLCCHDIAEPPLFRGLPPLREDEESEVERDERRRLLWQLAKLRECEGLGRKVGLLRQAVQKNMSISPAHQDFLVQALNAIHPVSNELTDQS